jgi:hypothetical protein
MLVEAGWAAARAPRVQTRRGQHVRCRRNGTQARNPDLASGDKERELPLGTAGRYIPRSCAISSSKPVTGRRADRKEWRTLTTSKAIATRNDAEMAYTRLVGTQGGQRRARAPRRRSADKGCAAGLPPCALLFTARSSVREKTKPPPAWPPASLDHLCARRSRAGQAGTEKRRAPTEQRNCTATKKP